VWLERYERDIEEYHADTGRSRLEICAEGYPADFGELPNLEPNAFWIYVGAQGGLAKLAALERDERILAYYRRGLESNASRVLPFIDAHRDFDNQATDGFAYARWRDGYAWEPQQTQQDAERVASSGKREILGDRKSYERRTMTAPLSAAAIAALGGSGTIGRDAIERAITHYDYTTINLCEFFFAECAYYALPHSAAQHGGSSGET